MCLNYSSRCLYAVCLGADVLLYNCMIVALLHGALPQVTAVTGDMRGAATDANVFLIMHGTLGDGMRHVLTGSHSDFDR